MNIVTKSGTNNYRGNRLRALPRQVDERHGPKPRSAARIEKQDYRRNQFGGSFGGPVMQDRVHFFPAVERTQQDTTQAVTNKGLFPA